MHMDTSANATQACMHIISSLLHHTLETKRITQPFMQNKNETLTRKQITWSICSCEHTSKTCLEIRGHSALPDMPGSHIKITYAITQRLDSKSN